MRTVIILHVLFMATSGSLKDDGWYWSWVCNMKSGRCSKVPRSSSVTFGENVNTGPPQHPSLAVCRLTCGKYGALWPRPTVSVELSRSLIYIDPREITFHILNVADEARDFIVENTEIFIENLLVECGTNCSTTAYSSIMIFISVTSSDMNLSWKTDESYSLQISPKGKVTNIEITANTVYGARHGLETLSQLITSFRASLSKEVKFVMVAAGKINDKPQFAHRGLLIDTARNFLSVKTIKRQIDAMAASKLNVLHWHATDSQSFPLESLRVPQLTQYGAYSSKQIYHQSDVIELLRYAKVRGVRVIVEIDAPSHAGNGWQWGKDVGLGDLAVCVNESPWRSFCIQPPCGQLNPVNRNLYSILGDLYADIIDVFPKEEVFHMGGDEVFFPCWNSSEEIVSFLQSKGLPRTNEAFLELWGEYQAEVLNVYDSKVGNSNTSIILWSSALTEPEIIEKYLPKERYIIETWVPSDNDLPLKLIGKGYKVIISTKDTWYLDHGFWGTTQYHTWRTAYENRIPRHPSILGGESCMWGELVDDSSIDSRVWPRAAAVAERLWSDPSSSTSAAERRFYRHRERLVARGIQAEAVTPRWCYQNEGECQ